MDEGRLTAEQLTAFQLVRRFYENRLITAQPCWDEGMLLLLMVKGKAGNVKSALIYLERLGVHLREGGSQADIQEIIQEP